MNIRGVASKLHLLTFALGLSLATNGCSKTVAQLAEGNGALADDAKAVLAAFAGSKLEGKEVPVVDPGGSFQKGEGYPAANVTVRGGRVVSITVIGAAGQLDFKALTPLKALESLWVSANSLLTHVDGLKKLPKLKTVYLEDNKVTQLKGLEDLPALRELKLERNPLKVVSGMKNVGLEELKFKGFRTLEKLERLENLPRLIRIAVSGTKLTSFSIANLPKLRAVVMKNNRLKTLSIKAMPKLIVINAKKNVLSSVALSGLPALTHLGLSNNKLTALPKVPGSSKLTLVTLNSNRITSLAGIEALHSKEIFLDRNKLTRLGPAHPAGAVATQATPLPHIVTLGFARNQLISIAGIERFTDLQYLYLDNNLLSSLEGIDKLKKLKKIRVSHNKLATLSPLKTAQLEELIATDNKIAAAPVLFGPAGNKRPKIKRYDLRRNAIAGVGAALLFHGLSRPSHLGIYVAPTRRSGSRGGRGYRGSGGIRYRGSRYSRGGGGYRSGK